MELQGDQVIQSDQTWSGKHVTIHGNLLLKGGTLHIENTTVEIMCEYARQFTVRWQGGDLETRHAVIGGTKRNNVTRPTVFEVYDGSWTMDDTTIQYSCGVVFSYATKGRIQATGLKPGENPDSIIVCGKADVTLRNCVFDLALHLPAYTGANATLDLPVGKRMTRVIDNKLVPGVDYRLDLDGVTAPGMWFLFFVSVRSEGPITRYNLGDCTNVVPGFTAENLRTIANLPCSWSGSNWPGVWRAMPPGTEVSVGALRVTTLTDKTTFAGWGVYLSGERTDVTITGSTTICELMVDQGVCKVQGTPKTHDIWLTCTTTDAKNGARLYVRNANLAYPEPSMHYKQIQATEGSRVILEDVVFGDHVDLIAHGPDSTIEINGYSGNRDGVKEVDCDGKVVWRRR